MPGPNYSFIPGDWTSLAIVLNDLLSRIVTTDVPTLDMINLVLAGASFDGGDSNDIQYVVIDGGQANTVFELQPINGGFSK